VTGLHCLDLLSLCIFFSLAPPARDSEGVYQTPVRATRAIICRQLASHISRHGRHLTSLSFCVVSRCRSKGRRTLLRETSSSPCRSDWPTLPRPLVALHFLLTRSTRKGQRRVVPNTCAGDTRDHQSSTCQPHQPARPPPHVVIVLCRRPLPQQGTANALYGNLHGDMRDFLSSPYRRDWLTQPSYHCQSAVTTDMVEIRPTFLI
jgi:hypothetical protein